MLFRKLGPCSQSGFKAQYASIAYDHWPQAVYPHRHPTPYQVLDIDPKAAYSKSRFNSLVKIYHPDRKDHPSCQSSSLSPAQRLERYHIIIAAHVLLSDPAKRQAYDKHGIGWLDGLENSLLHRAAAKDHGASRNATWEDWERWREQRQEREPSGTPDPEPQTGPVFMSHALFAGFLIACSVGAAKAQSMHAQSLTEARRAQREENHYKATRDFELKQSEAKKSTREKRIEKFLKNKDPAALRHARLTKMILDPDICDSGTESGKDRTLDMRRKFR